MGSKRHHDDEIKSDVPEKKSIGHWSMGLLSAMNDPALKVKEDDKIVIIKDKYPKAKYHFLILPKADISSLAKVSKEQLNLLKHMDEQGHKLAEKYSDSHFKLGYHAEASMSRLHLHVISDDFRSACLKTKKHWNTFTTDFFVPSSKIIADVEKHGKVIPESKEKLKKYIDTPLKCHKCEFVPKNMPTLKTHILTHVNKVV
ncbi:Aprataxin [Blattella germanica]|nr:Aprataxin [Blattella germanica]